MARYAKLSGKVLSLLANGLLLGYSKNRGERNELLKECDKIWLSIDRNELFHILRLLKLNKFITVKKDRENENFVSLSEKGRQRVRKILLDELSIKKPKRWDGKWRIVIFDIPEHQRKIRNSLRMRLKILGFTEFQKSVFAFPYSCEDEINILVNFFNLSENVRYLESSLSYDADLRKFFGI